jgi:hypothetical protein
METPSKFIAGGQCGDGVKGCSLDLSLLFSFSYLHDRRIVKYMVNRLDRLVLELELELELELRITIDSFFRCY